MQALGGQFAPTDLQGFAHAGVQVQGHGPQRQFAVHHSRDVQQVVDESALHLHVAADQRKGFPGGRRELGVLLQRKQGQPHGGQGRAQFVRERRQKPILGPVSVLGLLSSSLLGGQQSHALIFGGFALGQVAADLGKAQQGPAFLIP